MATATASSDYRLGGATPGGGDFLFGSGFSPGQINQHNLNYPISELPTRVDLSKSAGRGYYDLPAAFDNWSGPARAAFPIAEQYAKGVAPVKDYFQKELGTDYRSTLAERGRKTVDTQLSEVRRKGGEAMTRAGYAGGTTVSPLGAAQLEHESMARTGGYGLAAQQATMYAQQMKNAAATGLQNINANLMSAFLVPLQLQQSTTSKVPVSGGGPSNWAQAAQAAAALSGLFT